MLKIRWSQDCLIFNMGIFILVRRHLYIEMAPRSPLRKPYLKIKLSVPNFYMFLCCFHEKKHVQSLTYEIFIYNNVSNWSLSKQCYDQIKDIDAVIEIFFVNYLISMDSCILTCQVKLWILWRYLKKDMTRIIIILSWNSMFISLKPKHWHTVCHQRRLWYLMMNQHDYAFHTTMKRQYISMVLIDVSDFPKMSISFPNSICYCEFCEIFLLHINIKCNISNHLPKAATL